MIEAGYGYKADLQAMVFTAGEKTPAMVLDFLVVANERGEEINQSRKVYLYCSDGAWPYTKEKLERLGFNGNFSQPECSNAKGVELNCRHEEYEGKTNEKWDLAPPGGGMPEAAASDVAARFTARWKAGNGSAPPKSSTRPTTAPPATNGRPTTRGAAPAKKLLVTKAGKEGLDQAWDIWAKFTEGGQPDAKEFEAAIVAREKETGRGEAAFTVEDAHEIAFLKHVPF